MPESPEPIFYRGVDLLLGRAKTFLIIGFIGAVAAIGISYLVTPVFRAEAILVPSDEILGIGENAQGGALGGLASLVGAGSGAVNKETEAVTVMKSRGLTYAYIQTNNLLPILFPTKWDATAQNWKKGSDNKTPTLEDGFMVFDKTIRTVVENRKNGLITIAIIWKDPLLAKRWVDGIIAATNELLRHQALDRSNKNLAYLQQAADKAASVEVKSAIYKLMEAEIKKNMTALGSNEYAFRVIDAAVVPEHKSAPKRIAYAAFGSVISCILWLLVVSIRNRLKIIYSSRQ